MDPSVSFAVETSCVADPPTKVGGLERIFNQPFTLDVKFPPSAYKLNSHLNCFIHLLKWERVKNVIRCAKAPLLQLLKLLKLESTGFFCIFR